MKHSKNQYSTPIIIYFIDVTSFITYPFISIYEKIFYLAAINEIDFVIS